MDKKELKQLTKLYDKFFDDCCRVRDILIDSNKRHGEYVDITYADTFNIVGDYVSWEGDEYWEHGGYEEHSGYFPLDLLTMTDDELREIVAKENEELEREKEIKISSMTSPFIAVPNITGLTCNLLQFKPGNTA